MANIKQAAETEIVCTISIQYQSICFAYIHDINTMLCAENIFRIIQ